MGTAGDGRDLRRGWMCADWLIRVHLPAWLLVARESGPAARLQGLPEIRDRRTLQDAGHEVDGIRCSHGGEPGEHPSVDSPWDNRWAIAWAAARHVAWGASWAAAWEAVRHTSLSAAPGSATPWSRGKDGALDAASETVLNLAFGVVPQRLHEHLAPDLHDSALRLLDRMIGPAWALRPSAQQEEGDEPGAQHGQQRL
jgi:hypothetical protein